MLIEIIEQSISINDSLVRSSTTLYGYFSKINHSLPTLNFPNPYHAKFLIHKSQKNALNS